MICGEWSSPGGLKWSGARKISMHIYKHNQCQSLSLSSGKKKRRSDTYLPLTLHFSPFSSSSCATFADTPTATSALLVRSARIGNEPRSGPDRRMEISQRYSRREREKREQQQGFEYVPNASEKGVSTGHSTSPVSLYVAESGFTLRHPETPHLR